MLPRFFALFLGCFLLTGSSRAALVWETQRVAVTAQSGDKEVTAVFSFRNGGDTPVAITDVSTSCECTAAEPSQRRYAPGESGTIRAVFTLGERQGAQERTITVTCDDPVTPRTTLSFHVDIPELFSVSARMLHWSAGGPREEKIVEIRARNGNRIAAIETGGTTAGQLGVRVEAPEPGASYRLHILPGNIAAPATIPVLVTIRLQAGISRTLTLYALVR